jgi:hypothetical protein
MNLAVTTRSYDNTRSGVNLREQLLTPAAGGEQGRQTPALPGDARGRES